MFSEQDRSALYLELLPALNARSVVLLDQPELLHELRGLERRRGPSGRDKVDHRAGSHDDMANCVAGAMAALAEDAAFQPRIAFWCDDCAGIHSQERHDPFRQFEEERVTRARWGF